MTNVNVAAYSVYDGIAHLNSNGRIQTSVRITTSGNYTFEVIAGGTPALGILPQVAIPIVADVHFHFQRAMESIEAGVHKIRLNPGNLQDRKQVDRVIRACREMGIDVMPPDVNSSQQDFAVVGGVIHFGLNAVKNVGEAAAEAIGRLGDHPAALPVLTTALRHEAPAVRLAALNVLDRFGGAALRFQVEVSLRQPVPEAALVRV